MEKLVPWVLLLLVAFAYSDYRDSFRVDFNLDPRWIGQTMPPLVAAAIVLYGWYVVRALRRQPEELRAAEEARDEARAQTKPALENERLQERAVDLHVARLAAEIESLRRRAFVAFVPGISLCVTSVAGPWVAYNLITARPEYWQYMLGGSATALVLLGAGTALLRHDAKLHEQLLSSKSELLYFSRIQTGLDCARTLGAEEYAKGLALITAHLLAAPPSLVALERAEDKKGEATKTENNSAEHMPLGLIFEIMKEKPSK